MTYQITEASPELADAADLKSASFGNVGSSPTAPTRFFKLPSQAAGRECMMAESRENTFQDYSSFDSSQAPGGILVYYADGDEEILYVNQYVIDLFECDSPEDFLDHVKGSFRTFVYSQDIEAVEESIWEQVACHDGLDRICYRIQTKSGRLISVEDFGRLEQSPDGGRPVFYVFVSEMRQRGPVDWLTGLPSVEHFHKMATMGSDLIGSRGSRPVAIALDLIGMRAFNAKHGRDTGDWLICLFAEVLREHFGSDACSRYADGHFFAFAPEEGLDEKLDALLGDYKERTGEKTTPVKIGAYACAPEDDINTVGFSRAMVACEYGDNKWHSDIEWFNDEMRYKSNLRSHVLNNLDAAIENGWIRPYYQAVMRATTSEVCGEEALARWVDPKLGPLSPIQFIPVLEASSLLHKLDMHMVDCVLKDMAIKQTRGTDIVPVSVNISLRDLGKVNLAETIAAKVDAAGVSRSLLRVEFTESAASDDPDFFREQVSALRAAGFEVWMDDFGSGYSSLNTLKDFDFDVIKLDMGFISEGSKEKARDIIAGVIEMAHSIGVGTLAEGVETLEQAVFLEETGCGMLQGYYYTKPLPLDVIMDHFEDGLGLPRENLGEASYWSIVSEFELNDPSANTEGASVDGSSMLEFPAGIIEKRDGEWRFVRLNRSFKEFLAERGVALKEESNLKVNPLAGPLDNDYFVAMQRCKESGAWERISGRFEYGTGIQFFTRPLASSPRAEAFAIVSVPTMLGTALGSYGDVPVAYAVFRVRFNDAQDEVIDTEYVYANPMYCEWLGLEPNSLNGESFLNTVKDADTFWFSYCYRAVVNGETIHDVVYSPELDHWLSFNIAPSPMKGCCVYAFTQVDEEHRQQQKMIVGRDTSDLIIDIAHVLNGEDDYDTAMSKALEIMSHIVHPDRLYVFERGETTSSNTFEWCAEGVTPEIDTLQDLDNSAFDTWGKLLAEDSVVLIPDVAEFKDIDEEMYWTLERQGITHLLAVPFYSGGKLIGYLGADNYALEERFDTRRLLETVATFMSARIASQRNVEALTWTGLHDGLTEILNRRGIDRVVGKFVVENPDEPFVLALMDFDDFKSFNDMYGHGAGDAALVEVARAVEQWFPEGTIIGRNGGDEFLAMIVRDDVARADAVFEGFSQESLQCEYEGTVYPISLSIGYVAYPDQVDNLKAAYSCADKALYEVKRSGKAGLKKYLPSMG